MTRRGSPTAADADRILATVGAARDVSNGTRFDLALAEGEERVPATMLIPHGEAPVPAALVLHGLGSTKERMADTIGMALLARGLAVLAVDLPMHGGRPGADALRSTEPMQLLATWKRAVDEALLSIAYLASHARISGDIGIVGYSLGSFIANVVASREPRVKAVLLAASGDLPHGLPFESIVRAVLDPLRAVRGLAGRPLLMVNGRFDRTVTPDQAERLFAAAPEPKTMRWYGGGHWPPAREIDAAAAWLAHRLSDATRTPRTRASSAG